MRRFSSIHEGKLLLFYHPSLEDILFQLILPVWFTFVKSFFSFYWTRIFDVSFMPGIELITADSKQSTSINWIKVSAWNFSRLWLHISVEYSNWNVLIITKMRTLVWIYKCVMMTTLHFKTSEKNKYLEVFLVVKEVKC